MTLRTLTLAALLYSALHFLASGVRQPFDHPNLGKIDEHAAPLREHLRTGAPVHTVHPAQYGPVFFFVLHPLLGAAPDATTLAVWLYAIQVLCIAAAFLLTCATLRPLMTARMDHWPLVVIWLAIVWLNFSPLYTVLALKSVETWELCLIALALYAHLRGWPWIAALAIAAAGLIKVLPFVFLYYWLVTDRRTFARAALATAALLLASHFLYGSEMGAGYLPRMAASATSYGLDWHENISLKAALARLFGHLPAPTTDAARTSGYFIEITGWRRTAVSIVGGLLVMAGIAALTWSWMPADRARSRQRRLNEWSLLAVAVLILSPNTIFEYATLALGAVSYAFVALAAAPRHDARATAAFTASLLLLGGILPRQWLNRVTAIDLLNRWSGHVHLMPSEGYQYYGFPLLGLVLLAATIWRLQPPPEPA
jgi:Glycosyltransferase family 87